MNSRQKGKVGEREAAAYLREVFGCEARRGQQFQGTPDSPDIVCSIPGVHFEVKRVERLNLDAACLQAQADAGSKIPVVMHRRNRGPWYWTVRVDDVISLMDRIDEHLDQTVRRTAGQSAEDVRQAATADRAAAETDITRER